MEYQWYPGHMTKARRMMEENIRLVDLVIELVDARIPFSSRNPDIDALCRGKSRIVLLCKADLADPARTEQFQEIFRKMGILSAAVDARERRAGDVVRRYVQEACSVKLARDRARGIVGRPLRAMVAGIPNVGKSTFINSFAGRASAKTGNKPGVTRGKQWIRMGGGVELLDTPGILWPKFDSRETGMRLALVGAIRDELLDKQELAVWLLEFLEQNYPGTVRQKYLAAAQEAAEGTAGTSDMDAEVSTEEETAGGRITEDGTVDRPGMDLCAADLPGKEFPRMEEGSGLPGGLPEGYNLLMEIARARRLLKKGGGPDPLRAAAMVLDDCKNGRIGRISLDTPAEAAAFEKAAAQAFAETGGDPAAKAPSAAKQGAKRAGERDSARKDDGRPSSASRNASDKTGGKDPARKSGSRPSSASRNASDKAGGKDPARKSGSRPSNAARNASDKTGGKDPARKSGSRPSSAARNASGKPGGRTPSGRNPAQGTPRRDRGRK